MIALLSAYAALIFLAMLRRDGGQVLTAFLLLANWTLNASFVWLSGELLPWPWFIAVDWMTALVLYIDCPTKWQRALILTYAMELLMHAAYASSVENVWTRWHYWWALNYTAWAQVVLVGSWVAYDFVRSGAGDGRSFQSRLAGEQTK